MIRTHARHLHGPGQIRMGLFERGNGGTVSLDEIDDMPVALQAKLLRVLHERQVEPLGASSPVGINVRTIAATTNNSKKRLPTDDSAKNYFTD